jgi:hypothetical protein
MLTTGLSAQIGLTDWSSRRPQAPLAGALRASHSGAAYRGR